MRSIRALAVASEIYPIIKTGGLADVVGALPVALNAEGIEVRTIVPGFPDVMQALGSRCLLASKTTPPTWLIDSEPFPVAVALPAKNGVLNLASVASGNPVLHPLTPAFFCQQSLDYAFEANAPAPALWLNACVG